MEYVTNDFLEALAIFSFAIFFLSIYLIDRERAYHSLAPIMSLFDPKQKPIRQELAELFAKAERYSTPTWDDWHINISKDNIDIRRNRQLAFSMAMGTRVLRSDIFILAHFSPTTQRFIKYTMIDIHRTGYTRENELLDNIRSVIDGVKK